MIDVEPASRLKTHLYAFLLASAGFFFGASFAMFNTYLKVFAQNFGSGNQELIGANVSTNINVFYVLGCTLSCLCGGFLYQHVGRFRTLVLIISLDIAASGLVLLHSLRLIYLMRFLHGFAACYSLLLIPVMMRENLPRSFPDVYNPVFSALLSAGMLTSFFFGHPNLAAHWRYVLAWPLCVEAPRLLLLALLFPMESPAWLAARGRPAEELSANYAVLYAAEDAQRLAAQLLQEKAVGLSEREALRDAFAPAHRPQLLLCVLMNAAVPLSCNSLLNMYSTRIFQQLHAQAAGGGLLDVLDDPANMTIIMGLWNVLSCLSMVGMLRAFGKRRMMIAGLIGLVAACAVFLHGVVLGSRLVMTVGISLYAISFTYSLGGVLLPYCVEILPAPALSLTSLMRWTLHCLIVMTNERVFRRFGAFWVFFFAQSVCTCSAVYFIGYSVDSDGKSAEEIKAEFSRKKFLS